jgi:hypothetical protein
MMCHLFLEEDPLAVRNGTGQLRDNFRRIDLACCYHFVCAGVLFACCTEIMSIKRLIYDKGVGPIAPGPHHRG